MNVTALRKGMVIRTKDGRRYRLVEPYIDAFILGKLIDDSNRVAEQPDLIRVSAIAQVEVRDADGFHESPVFHS